MATDSIGQGALLIEGGRVYDHAGDVDQPPVADILIVDGTIVAVRRGLADAIVTKQPVPELGTRTVTETIDATEKLVIPGFVNAHYHSHDVLLKGCFETIPLELWVLSALPPSYPKRSTAEIRARTLLGAIECLRSGISTVQDLATIYPFDEEHLDAMLKAYDDVGIRCVFALQVVDVPGAKSIPFWDEVVPADQRGALSGAVDAQNMFQSMKMFAALAAVCDPEPGPPTAADAIWSATIGGARTAGLEGRIGVLRPGMAADLSIVDLTDPSFVPLNSVARQLVFTEAGRAVETVIVDGRVVVRDRKITTIDERALREEVADLMRALRKDIEAVVSRNQRMMPYLMEAHRRTWAADIGLNRYVGGGSG